MCIPTGGAANFYPRPPRGGRLRAHQHLRLYVRISIHALREEGDGVWIFDGLKCTLFLSTPSARRATPPPDRAPVPQADFYPRPPRGGRPITRRTLRIRDPISIHALREEGDNYRLPQY